MTATPPTILISTPVPPDDDLVGFIHEEIDAALGADVEVVLSGAGDRGAAEVAPYVLVMLPLSYVGKVLLDAGIEAAGKKVGRSITGLLRRLRAADPGGPDIRVGDSDTETVFVFDRNALRDPRAEAQMHRLDARDFVPGSVLRWDPRVACWRRSRHEIPNSDDD